MTSLAQQALMLEALSGDSDHHFPHGMKALREQAAQNPDRWWWYIEEAQRRRAGAKQ